MPGDHGLSGFANGENSTRANKSIYLNHILMLIFQTLQVGSALANISPRNPGILLKPLAMNYSETLKVISLFMFLILSFSSGITIGGEQASITTTNGSHNNQVTINSQLQLQAQARKLFVELSGPGYIPVTLHPNTTVELNKPTIVVFGVPFPRNTLSGPSAISITGPDNNALASQTRETSRWRSLHKKTTVDSIRSVAIYAQVTFTSHKPMIIHVNYGVKNTHRLAKNISLVSTWETISAGPDPLEYAVSENIKEPKVYATLPPQWLGACLLRTRSLPMGYSTDLTWFDTAFSRYTDTAVNNVSQAVRAENLVPYEQSHEPWLYDRAMTLFGIYIRTGELKWLRHAHRASQFYAKHITDSGYFDKKKGYKNSPPNDLKYSYGQSMLLDLMLTGDTRLITKIESVADAAQQWNDQYQFQTQRPKLWTERHQAYALLAALSAWEATGKKSHANRVNAVINNTLSLASQPGNNWKPEGCPLHAYKDHEGFGSNEPVCSSWMNALLAEVVFRYYIHSEDNKALEYLSNLGHYLEGSGTYVWNKGGAMQGLRMPHYLSSNAFKRYPDGDWDDHHHACDVAGAAARSAWARNRLGENNQSLVSLTRDLLKSCRYSLDYMHRKDADRLHGKTVWRLSVPRQYSWWFGSTHDLGWLLGSMPD